jgi:hypothetical protein
VLVAQARNQQNNAAENDHDDSAPDIDLQAR